MNMRNNYYCIYVYEKYYIDNEKFKYSSTYNTHNDI